MSAPKKLKNGLIAIVIILLFVTLGILISTLLSNDEDAKKEEPWPLQYEETVTKYSDMYHVPMYVIYATIRAESSFNAEAESSVGAVGLMQIMPKTYEWLCAEWHLNEVYTLEKLKDPDTNIRVGTYYLSWLYSVFEDWELVSAAYNAGHGNVKEWLTNPEYSKDGKLTYIPFDETRNYVKKVLSYEESYKRMYADRGWMDYTETVPKETETTVAVSGTTVGQQ